MKKRWVTAILYWVFFALVLIQFPLNGSLIGNSDAIGHLAIFYDHYFNLMGWLNGSSIGNIFYPADGIVPYVESYLGETVIFFAARSFGLNDIWASFVLITTLYSLNAFAVFLYAHYKTKKVTASVVASIFFAASSFMLSNSELLNGLAFFCVPLSLYFMERYLDEQRIVLGISAIIAITSTYYFSSYHYMFGFGLLLATCIWHYEKWRTVRTAHLVGLIVLFALFSIPVLGKLTSPLLADAYNPLDDIADGPARFSLSLQSLVSALNGHWFYPSNWSSADNVALKMDYKANFGVVAWVLLIIGVVSTWKMRGFFLILFISTLLFALGPFIMVGDLKVWMPLHALYQFEAVERFFRIPGRIFVLANFAMAVICAHGYARLEDRWQFYNTILVTAVLVIFLLENIAVKQHTVDHRKALVMPTAYDHITDDGTTSQVMNLPSSIFVDGGYVNGISEFTREYRYQYWQTKHHQDIINGSASYFPKVRMENNELMNDITLNGNLETAIAKNELDYIVYHHKLNLREKEEAIWDFLRSTEMLEMVHNDDQAALFKVKNL